MSEQAKKKLENLLSQLKAAAEQRDEEAYIQKWEQVIAAAETDEIKEAILGKAIKDLDHREKEKAISRLNAIPSELEVMLYLYSKGKILFAVLPWYTEKLNVEASIDVCFMDQEEPGIGYTNMAGVDAKNPKVDYDNFLIETKKSYDNGETWYEKYAWARHFVTGTNRYLAYVRGGQKYGDNGGKLATETPVYSEDKTERENKEAIVEYFWNNRQWLNHPIEIIRGEDVKAYLHDHGAGKQLKSYMMGHEVPISEWVKSYPALRVEKTGDSWQEMQLGEQEPLILCTDKRPTTADIQKIIEKVKEAQAGELTLQMVKRLFALSLTYEDYEEEEFIIFLNSK